jgi:hypothetical protein
MARKWGFNIRFESKDGIDLFSGKNDHPRGPYEKECLGFCLADALGAMTFFAGLSRMRMRLSTLWV